MVDILLVAVILTVRIWFHLYLLRQLRSDNSAASDRHEEG